MCEGRERTREKWREREREKKQLPERAEKQHENYWPSRTRELNALPVHPVPGTDTILRGYSRGTFSGRFTVPPHLGRILWYKNSVSQHSRLRVSAIRLSCSVKKVLEISRVLQYTTSKKNVQVIMVILRLSLRYKIYNFNSKKPLIKVELKIRWECCDKPKNVFYTLI